MSNASRIPLRRQWREDHPYLRAIHTGKLTRRSFGLYKIEMMQPARYAAMVARALGNAGAKPDANGDVIVSSPEAVDKIADAVEAQR